MSLKIHKELNGKAMNIKEAQTILGISGALTEEAIKAHYRRASSKYHPDRNPNGLEMMKNINVARDVLINFYKSPYIQHTYHSQSKPKKERKPRKKSTKKFDEIIAFVILLDGVTVEYDSNFIYASGNTFEHKEELKSKGFRWCPDNRHWYFRY